MRLGLTTVVLLAGMSAAHADALDGDAVSLKVALHAMTQSHMTGCLEALFPMCKDDACKHRATDRCTANGKNYITDTVQWYTAIAAAKKAYR